MSAVATTVGNRALLIGGRQVETGEWLEVRSPFTGELVGASDSEVTVAADDGIVSIPYSDINRSNLLEG